MSWNVFYSSKAQDDLKAIYEYIAFELLAPDTASNQVKRIMKSVKLLSEMPMRYKLYDDEPWKSKKLRCFSVNNYLVFFIPKEEEKAVNIVRIIYGGRDITQQLEETTEI